MCFIITPSTSLLKKRENIPYTLSGRIFGGKHTSAWCSGTRIGLNTFIDTEIRSLYRRLIPLGSVRSLTLAIFN